MQKTANARASVLSDDYLKQGSKTIPGIGHIEPMKPKEEEKKPESKIPSSAMPIPGMRNQNSKAQELTKPEECIGCASCALMCPDCVIRVER